MGLPKVVSREEWLTARKELLVREKELTRQRDQLNADRRRLPMVKIEKRPQMDRRLPELLGRGGRDLRRPPGALHTRDTTFVAVSRAPLAKIEDYKAARAGPSPVTLDASVMPVEYNYRTEPEPDESMEAPGQSCFLRDGDAVFHTYSNYARGAEMTGGSYYSSTSPPSAARRSGRSPRTGPSTAGAPSPTSRPERRSFFTRFLTSSVGNRVKNRKAQPTEPSITRRLSRLSPPC